MQNPKQSPVQDSRQSPVQNPKHILLIRFSSLGDLVLLSSLIAEIKQQYPQAKLSLLTAKEFAQLHQFNPHLNSQILLNRQAPASAEFQRVLKACLTHNFDWVLDAHNSLRSRWLVRRLGQVANPPVIRRVDKRNFKRHLLVWAKLNTFKTLTSQRDAYLGLLSLNPKKPLPTQLFIPAKLQKHATNLLKPLGAKLLLAIAPSAAHLKKCWPKEYFLSLIHQLPSHIQVVLLGGKEPVHAWLTQQSKKPLLDLSGSLTYLESAAVLKHCNLVIANDSAVVHLAEAMQTPAISLFGPTVPAFGFAPFLPESVVLEKKLWCRPCSRNGQGGCFHWQQQACLKQISSEEVLKHVLQILNHSAQE